MFASSRRVGWQACSGTGQPGAGFAGAHPCGGCELRRALRRRRVALDATAIYRQAKTGGFVHQTPAARPANRVRSTGAPLGWIPVNRRGSITCTTVPILPRGSVAGRAVCASTSTAGWESSRRRRATPRHSEASNHVSRWTARARCCSAPSPRDAAATCRSSHHTAEPRAVTGSQNGTRAATSA